MPYKVARRLGEMRSLSAVRTRRNSVSSKMGKTRLIFLKNLDVSAYDKQMIDGYRGLDTYRSMTSFACGAIIFSVVWRCDAASVRLSVSRSPRRGTMLKRIGRVCVPVWLPLALPFR